MKPYRTPVFDNARWANFVHRAGDIYVCTPPKCGTTWMQAIVASLLWPDGDVPGSVAYVCPWIDAEFRPIDDVLAQLEAQTHRRSIKTHTPADGIPWFDTGQYIVVGRDGRDAFMSWVNHLAHMKDDHVAVLNERAALDGVAPLVKNRDIHGLFAEWLVEGRVFNHIRTFWDRRDAGNVLFVHYNDMKADLDAEMRRVANFLAIDVPEQKWPAVVERCTFAGMKSRPDEISEFNMFEGGASSFLFKGTNDRWRDVLTADEVKAYAERVAELLPADAAAWLERGRAG